MYFLMIDVTYLVKHFVRFDCILACAIYIRFIFKSSVFEKIEITGLYHS